MITVSSAPTLPADTLSLYYAKDALLEDLPFLIFYGPSTTGNSTLNSSRIQAHIYSLAGFQSFSRLTIAPTSPLYTAVNHLPSDKQGDEVYRGIAVSLLSYFAGLPKAIKNSLRGSAAMCRLDGVAPAMFDETHAGDLAASMVCIEENAEIADYIVSALSTQVISWVDMDVYLPLGTIQQATLPNGKDQQPSLDDNGLPLFNYGRYSRIIDLLGSPAFLPTSKIKRAPSRPTAHSKTQILSKNQKITLRREMCELVDTENNYVCKLRNLVDSVAVRVPESNRSDLFNKLFPESLMRLRELNELFCNDVQTILDATENEAIGDIESKTTNEGFPTSSLTSGRKRDPTGIGDFAKAMLKWFPKFAGPYQDYLRASLNFPVLIAEAMADESSSMPRQLHEFGEQRLRSALIEPVQRLPRYSLFIDNIVNLLPASHLALSSLLKSKDIVTDICALDTHTTGDPRRHASIMRSLVAEWPVTFSPAGRLITAVDVSELLPPYAVGKEGMAGVLLVFPDTAVFLQKVAGNSLSARGILAEVDRPTMQSNASLSSSLGRGRGLLYLEAFDLSRSHVSESEDGRIVQLIIVGDTLSGNGLAKNDPSLSSICRKVLLLTGPYEGKATRLSEEISKARIEGRFPEFVRESGRWALRSINPTEGCLGILVALTEDTLVDGKSDIRDLCRIQVFVDGSKDIKSILRPENGINVAACISTSDTDCYRLEAEGADGSRFSDCCTTDDLIQVLHRRLGSLVRLQHQAHSPTMAETKISYNRTILGGIPILNQQEDVKTRNSRPISPVKMISNLLSGGGIATQSNTPSKFRARPPIIGNLIPAIPPPLSSTKTETQCHSEEISSGNKVTVVDSTTETFRSPFDHLEDTFAAYAIALRSRSGTIVGKVLRSRAMADELAINELYNALLEDPCKLQAAAEVPVDVLFAAFEKFLKRAWRERMGPLITFEFIQTMQTTIDSGKPALFSQEFRKLLEDLSPQNKRAFAACVHLLSDLLDASGNDGDRGALIASFAEALIPGSNPHDYITLLDRLVDDYDNLFADAATEINEGNTRSTTSSLTRTRSFNTGSLSSNASSLRKKFGFGTLSRENSKNESESKVSSFWRTLSKNSRNPGEIHPQPSNSSKPFLSRSRSTDTDSRMQPPLRPVSRDRPKTSGSEDSDEPKSRPGSAHLNFSTLSSIGEGTPTKPESFSRKKRRSSLSDLTLLRDPATATAWSPLQPRKPENTGDRENVMKTLPRIPSPVKQTSGQRMDRQSPQPSGLPRRVGSPQRKENSPFRETSPPKTTSPSTYRDPNTSGTSQQKQKEVATTSISPRKRTTSRSAIPAAKSGELSERTWLPNSNNVPPKKTPSSPQKLRIQSPQKLRERLNQEQKALNTTETALQAEIAKIGEEMAIYRVQRSPSKPKPKPKSTKPAPATDHPRDPSPSPSPTFQSLSNTLDALSAKINAFTTTHNTTLTSLSSDLESSLLVSDKKARKLDDLYREANAENEALYERFNDELGKILGKVRKGEGVQEMREKMGEAQGEVVKLRKENAKLKRDVVGLRSLLKGE